MNITKENLESIIKCNEEYNKNYEEFCKNNNHLIEQVEKFSEEIENEVKGKYRFLLEKYHRDILFTEMDYEKRNMYISLWSNSTNGFMTNERYTVPFDSLIEILSSDNEMIELFKTKNEEC